MTPEEMKKEFDFLRTELQAMGKLMEMQKVMTDALFSKASACLEIQKYLLNKTGISLQAAQIFIEDAVKTGESDASSKSGTVYGFQQQKPQNPSGESGRN